MLDRRRRIVVGVLAVLAVALLLLSIRFPYWKVTLRAPQYPQGLHLQVYLNHVEGDTFEIDLLNHYIGMEKIENAARFERSVALYALAIISVLTLLFLFSSRKAMSLLALPALLFPLAFVADLFYWLYRFGHNLDPRAPIEFPPFTPHILGEGKIGQFSTVGSFGLGFYLALGATVLILAALVVRFMVCNKCPYKDRCSVTCPYLFFWSPPEYRS